MKALRLKQRLREQPWMQPIRLANLKWRQRNGLFPDWRIILGSDWQRFEALRDAARANADAPRMLIATSVGVHTSSSIFDSYLATALTARGARCEVALCDAVLPACLAADYTWYPNPDHFARRGSRDDLCTACLAPAERLFGAEGLGLSVLRYGALLSEADRARARSIAEITAPEAVAGLMLDGIAVGEAALSGALRFFARGELESGKAQAAILKRYLEAACLSLFAMRNLLARERYDVVIGHHGIYVPQALVAAAAHEAGVRFVAWNPAYRTGCFIFSHGETYHRSMLSEPASAWENVHLDEAEQTRLMRYLSDRERGTQDWIAFHPADAPAIENIVGAVGLDPAKPVVTLLTSVVWDAQLHYRARAFKNQVEWVLKTISHFASRDEVQLVIRVHPAEVTGSLPSRQPIAAEIEAAFPTLPKNVALVRPGEDISTYALAAASDAVIIYATKTGIELAARGIPVIVAGEAWLRGKGIGFDCDDAEAYERRLASLPLRERLDPERTARAQSYAYHFFFRRMIPLPGLKRASVQGAPYEVVPQGLQAFAPGAHASIDCVCDGILTGTPFVLDGPEKARPSGLDENGSRKNSKSAA
ncbi:MAG: capsular biosynthesis protein [Methyloceanibacter sp.]|nr:capsular biosynthesis protein [Methyloceanibacter sp.]